MGFVLLLLGQVCLHIITGGEPYAMRRTPGYFFLSLHAFPLKGALGYEADPRIFFFFFESIRLSPEGSLRL